MLRQAEAVVFPGLGLAVAAVDPQRLAGDGSVLAVTPELVHHVLPEVPEGYLAGYRDAVADLTGRLPAGQSLTALRVAGVAAVEEARGVRLPLPDAPVQ